MNKIVTICGSMKFKDKMMEVAKELEIKNNYVVIRLNKLLFLGTT